MGGFASSLFMLLLGWVRSAASWLWSVWGAGREDGLAAWFSLHWKGFLIALCVLCMLVDFLIYLLRWQPQRVWSSYFRRRRDIRAGRHRPMPELLPEEALPEEAPEDDPLAGAHPDIPVWLAEASRQDAAGDTAPAVPLPAPAPLPEDSIGEPPEEPIARRPRRAAAPRRVSRLNLSALLAGEDEPSHLKIRRVAPAMDKNEAYNEPYIPPQWKQPGDVGSATRRRRRSP